jgi:hypothetical protein
MTMQKIKESQWMGLQDAYGKASAVPALLAKVISNKSLKSDPQSGPWFDLWSRLYHQGSIYTASYAAVIALAEAMKVYSALAYPYRHPYTHPIKPYAWGTF